MVFMNMFSRQSWGSNSVHTVLALQAGESELRPMQKKKKKDLGTVVCTYKTTTGEAKTGGFPRDRGPACLASMPVVRPWEAPPQKQVNKEWCLEGHR